MLDSKKISPELKILNDRYIIKEELGNGVTSVVYKVEDMLTKEIKAAKIYGYGYNYEFEREVKIMKKISEINSSSNIKYFESGFGYLRKREKNLQKMFIILEYGNKGSLLNATFKTKDGFSEDVSKFIFSLGLNAVEGMHKNGFCHRDIKPDNMLFVGDNYDLKLCDFGYSKKFLDKNNQKIALKKKVGTLCYCAPEIIEGKNYDGEKIDIFSLGTLLFALMTKKIGFTEAKKNDPLYRYIRIKKYDKYWEILEQKHEVKILPEKFKKLFVKLVAYDPNERPSFDEIRKDEWMQEFFKLNEEQLNSLRNKMINEIDKRSS